MLGSSGRRKLGAIGVFALPIGLVWVTGIFFGGPSTVSADMTLAPVDTTVPVLRIDTTVPADAQAALDRIELLRQEDFGPSPFLHQERQREVVVIVDDPKAPPPPPVFIVKAIMGSASGSRALIEGRWYGLGDGLGDTEWLVIEIDAAKRSVTIRDPETDRVYTATVDVPGLKRSQKSE